MSHHPLDEPDDESSTAGDGQTNERFDKIRRQIYASRSKQFGLGALLFLMAATAIVLAWLRQSSGSGIAGAVIPLTVLFGVALSMTGLIMLLESARLSIKEQKRLAGTFMRFGLVLLLGGLPACILLAILFAYLVSL